MPIEEVIIISLPFVGAAFSLLLWSHPRAVKWMAGLVTAITFAGLLIGLERREAVTSFLMMLFAVTALAAIMGQQRIGQASFSHMMVLLVLGFSLGTLATSPPIAHMLLAGMMGILSLAVWRAGRIGDSLRSGAVVSLGVGALSLIGALADSDPGSTLLPLIAYATLLPLFPLHAGFVGSLSCLPGTLPAFLVVVLPCLGWYGLTAVVQDVPVVFRETLMILAIGGALLGIMRAAVQVHLARVLGSITAALLAAVWWHLGVVGTVASTGGYVAAVTVAASGLLLGAHLLEARYGVLDVEKLGGLARVMPRFTVLMGLLFMAAMGLPLFGVFSSFMTMMFAASTSNPSMVLVLLVWFVTSLLLLKVWHVLFYGRPREDLLYQDLTFAELLPFAVMIGLLVLGGRVAANVFPVPNQSSVAIATAEGHP